VTLAAASALIVPNIRELGGSDETGPKLFHCYESVMLPDGCQEVLNMSSLIPGVAIVGSQSSFPDE